MNRHELAHFENKVLQLVQTKNANGHYDVQKMTELFENEIWKILSSYRAVLDFLRNAEETFQEVKKIVH